MSKIITLPNPNSWCPLTTKSTGVFSAWPPPPPTSHLSLSHIQTQSPAPADRWSGRRVTRQSSNRARDGWRLHPLRRRPQSHRLLFSGDTPRSARSHSDRHGLTQSDLYRSRITRYLQRTTQVLFYSAKSSRKQYTLSISCWSLFYIQRLHR